MSVDSSTEPDRENQQWQRLFPYDKPYPDQADAINEIREVATKGGFAIVEAACGTGKTLMSLDAGVDHVRDSSSKYQQVLCLTSVHQQLRAFEDDLEAINANLPEDEPPVSAITLVGKAGLCSYTDSGAVDSSDIYSRCDELREPIRDAMAGNSKQEQQKILSNLVQRAEAGQNDTPVNTGQWTAPYSDGFPEYKEDDYCGFYARSRLDTLFSESGYTPNGVLTPDDLLKQASENGLCPHAVMGSSIDNAEVVIANYQHIFNSRTVDSMTGSLIDDETFLVCDEAHTIIPRAKDELSQSLSLFTLERAINEIEYELLNQPVRGASDIMWSTLNDRGIKREQVSTFLQFLKRLQDRVTDWILNSIDDASHSAANWRESGHQSLPEDLSTGLREADSPGQLDWLTKWVENNGFQSQLSGAQEIGVAIASALENASENHGEYKRLETYTDSVGKNLTHWYDCDHTQYFRELKLTRRDEPYTGSDTGWGRHYQGELVLNNCIPSMEIADRLSHFGGGVLMSATLAPLDVFRETSGLSRLKKSGRHVRELTYGLSFPEKNRDSLVVDLPPYTKPNRGGITSNNKTRRAYASALYDVIRETDGNVLVAMPNYNEARWAASTITKSDEVNKDVLLDQSSSSEETEELKTDFFAGGPKVMCTSMRGTVTEGVDYSGDKLDACVVCGVPFTHIGGEKPTAVKAAYADAFGSGQAFDYAFTVPAVQKARQTWGRVIRGREDLGVRIVLDVRYTEDDDRSVRNLLPAYEDEEFTNISQSELSDHLARFWGER